VEQLVAETRPRLANVFAHGTTTAEVKTGYGLETAAELRQLEAIAALDGEGPLDLIPTFLGAHAVPPEFGGDPDGYTALLCAEMLPALRDWCKAQVSTPKPRFGALNLPFVDVFCETGAFSLAQSRRILEAARTLGFPLKIHADEFDNLGGASLAVALKAASADHLVKTSQDDIDALGTSDTVAVALPCTPFGLAEAHYTPARALLDAGAILALASDLNPGTAWCGDMQFVIALACRYMKLTPAQAIVAATINAAAALRHADQIGSLEVGKQADVLILSVDDYRHLGYRFGENLVEVVIKKGNVYRGCD
jgi:imidazolonepropionase